MPTYKWTHRKFADIGGPGDCDAPEPDELTDDEDTEMSEEEFEDRIREERTTLESRPARVWRSSTFPEPYTDDTEEE